MTNSNQTGNNDPCCSDSCKTSFKGSGHEIVNVYKCNQAPFSRSDMWKIQRQKKAFQLGDHITMF